MGTIDIKDTHKAKVCRLGDDVGKYPKTTVYGYETKCFWVFNGYRYKKASEHNGEIINRSPPDLFVLKVNSIKPLTTDERRQPLLDAVLVLNSRLSYHHQQKDYHTQRAVAYQRTVAKASADLEKFDAGQNKNGGRK